MTRKKPNWRQGFDARYWHQVEIQDAFWRGTFADFIKPLQGLYKDPASAGAFILSRFLGDEADTKKIFKSEPEAFGALLSGAIKKHAEVIYAELVAGRRGWPSIKRCAEKFDEAHNASLQLARLAAEHPALYSELQQERRIRNSKRAHVEVQFLGKSVYVEAQGSLTRRRYRKKLPPGGGD